jgi:SulP family sulfate permease
MGDEQIDPRILLFGLEGEFFFGSAVAFENHLEAIEARVQPATKYVVLRLKRVRNPDAVCMTLLDAFVSRMEDRGVHVLMCGVRAELYDALDKIGMLERFPERVFVEQPVRNTSTLMAVKAAYDGLGGEQRAEGMYYMI